MDLKVEKAQAVLSQYGIMREIEGRLKQVGAGYMEQSFHIGHPMKGKNFNLKFPNEVFNTTDINTLQQFINELADKRQGEIRIKLEAELKVEKDIFDSL